MFLDVHAKEQCSMIDIVKIRIEMNVEEIIPELFIYFYVFT